MTARDEILQRVRAALRRGPNVSSEAPPPVRLRIPEANRESRIVSFTERLEALAARVVHAADPAAARDTVESMIAGQQAVASNARYLFHCGITDLPGVRSGITDSDELRRLCATTDVGITSADYALADTGTLVLLSSPQEARLISLLPPAHLAIVPANRLLTGLEELFSVVPEPAAISSSMVLITGPSRTADIEQILVRGVHGPGQLIVVLVDEAVNRETSGRNGSIE